MLIYLAILLITVSIIAAILVIYDLYCIFGAKRFEKDVKEEGKRALENSSKINIIIWLAKKSRSVRNADSSGVKRAFSVQINKIISIALYVLVRLLYLVLISAVLSIVVYTLEQQITTTSVIMQSLFGADKDCKCYAECTGNSSDDEKCVYELLFGQAEYEKLISHMEETLPYSDIEYFDDLDKTTDGKAKSDFIRARINEKMVNDYKAIVGSNSKFRKEDGKDRSKMSYDELKEDLFNLLCDYKLNGRNPNCECYDCAKLKLKYKCIGMSHYRNGWSWDAIWDIPYFGNSEYSEVNTPGNATGQFAIKLNDGNYYWYHQSSEICDYNAFDEKYGYLGSVKAGGTSKGTMSSRGCGIYSTAIALSNLLGEEITPYDVIQDVMGCEINISGDGTAYFESYGNVNGITYSGDDGVIMYMSKLAELINKTYGSKGIVAEVVKFDQSTVDSYLFNDSSYAYCINSWQKASGFTWYHGSGHFMVLRPGSETGKYKCFTSASTTYGSGHANITLGMNDEMNWNIVKNASRHGSCLMISRDKSYYKKTGGGTGGGTVGYNKEVYDILVADKRYSAKALALASVYATLEPDYGRNFAIGMMANVNAEGNFGMIEGIWTSTVETKTKKTVLNCSCHKGLYANYYWGDVSGDVHDVCTEDGNGKTYVNASRVDYLLANIPEGVQGIGIGTVQWSGSRRIGILNTFKNSCKSYSQDELAVAEVLFMKTEFEGGYKYVVDAAKGKSAQDCARVICKKYEMPSGVDIAAETRAAYAAELESLLKDVTTSGVTAGGTSGEGGGIPEIDTPKAESKGQEVANYAINFVGNHYKWGGTNINVSNWSSDSGHLAHVNVSDEEKKKCPLDGADCSGFVLAVYKHFGKELPHSSSSQASVGVKVNNPSIDNMLPGDIICYSGHVAIYIGDGKIVHASNHKDGIKISDKWNYTKVIAVRRIFY